MQDNNYLCPPKMNKSFLLAFWTVPETIVIAAGIAIGILSRIYFLIPAAALFAIVTARLNMEHNIVDWFVRRIRYLAKPRRYTQPAPAATDRQRRKQQKKQMKSALPIQKIVSFHLNDNSVERDGKTYYFYRWSPPNTSIMTDEEIAAEITQLGRLFDALRKPFTIFATDKIENLAATVKYYSTLAPEYDYITGDIVHAIEANDTECSSVQRAFYFIYATKEPKDEIYNQLAGRGYHISRAEKPEIAVLLRNYYVREFLNVDIYTIAQEVDAMPDMAKAKQVIYDKEIQRRLSPHNITFGVNEAHSGNYFRRTIMIKNLPARIPACAFMNLAGMRGTTFTLRLTPMRADNARVLIDKQIKAKRATAGSSSATQQIDAQNEAQSIIQFYSELSRKKNLIYNMSVYIEMYGKTKSELAEALARVADELAGMGITYESLAHEQKDAFESVQPLGHDVFIADSNSLPSQTAAACYPCSYSTRSDTRGMLLGRTVQGGNAIVDMWLRDGNITNSNAFVCGAPGQGKSWLLKIIITFMFITRVKCFIFDPENEYGELARGLGGTVINCADGAVKINPFEVRAIMTNLDIEESVSDEYLGIDVNTPTFYQHISWLADFFSVLFPKLGDVELKALMIFVRDMYTAHGITPDSAFGCMAHEDYPTFSDLYNFIAANTDKSYKMITKDVINTLLLYLDDAANGALGQLLNGNTNISNDRLICFSMRELLEGSEDRKQAVLFNVMTYIWSIICRREGRVIMEIDELHMYLENPLMAKYIQSFYKRVRKYNAGIIGCTQQLGDCLDGKLQHYTRAIVDCSAFKYLFYPGNVDLKLMKKSLDLTDGEMECISSSNKRHCLLKAGNDVYHIETGTLPFERELFGKGGGE